MDHKRQSVPRFPSLIEVGTSLTLLYMLWDKASEGEAVGKLLLGADVCSALDSSVYQKSRSFLPEQNWRDAPALHCRVWETKAAHSS